jgi:hypothetical protein
MYFLLYATLLSKARSGDGKEMSQLEHFQVLRDP